MRAPWVAVLLGACSFHEGYLSPDPDPDAPAPPADGGHRDANVVAIDAPMIDAAPPPDAPLTPCQMHATAKLGGTYYFATADNSLGFLAAEDECSQFGGRLVKITGSDENAFVATTFTSGTASAARTWIGLADPLDNNVYVWIDGDPLLFDYNAFSFGIPPASDNNCVDTGSNGVWATSDCSDNAHGGTCECD